MRGKRLVWGLPALGLIGSQAGHLLAYQLRFGAAAPQMQATAAHLYFPSLAKTGLGLAALAFLGALFAIGAGRILAGRRLERDATPPFVRLLAPLFTIQLACFAAQETVEAMAGGGHLASVPALLLWGTLGQLPVAIVATLALRWLGARVRPAIVAIAARLPSAGQVQVSVVAPRTMALAAEAVTVRDTLIAGSNRRGPPSFQRSAL